MSGIVHSTLSRHIERHHKDQLKKYVAVVSITNEIAVLTANEKSQLEQYLTSPQSHTPTLHASQEAGQMSPK